MNPIPSRADSKVTLLPPLAQLPQQCQRAKDKVA